MLIGWINDSSINWVNQRATYLDTQKCYPMCYLEVSECYLGESVWAILSCVHRCWFSPSVALRGRASRILIFKYFCAMMTVKQSVCITEGLFINNVIICLPCPWCVWYKLSWLLYVFFAFFIHFWTRKTILFRGTFVSKHQMALSSMNYSICTLRVTLFPAGPRCVHVLCWRRCVVWGWGLMDADCHHTPSHQSDGHC